MAKRFQSRLTTINDSSGNPLSGGQIFFYESGTTTKLDTYSDTSLTTANSNPVVLGSDGRLPNDVYLKDQAYTYVLAPAADTDPPTSAIITVDDYWGMDIRDTFQTGILRNQVSGLIPSNNTTDPEHDIDFTAGTAFAEDGSDFAVLAALTKRFDAAFSAGTNQGALGDGVSLPTSGTLYAFAIKRDSDGATDILGDTSPTGANIPSGWSIVLGFASFETDASANIESFTVENTLAFELPQATSVPYNFLLNGSFNVAQRGTTYDSTTSPYTNDDGNYILDRWVLLSDGNDIVDVSQETSVVPDGAATSCKLDIETADKKAGILQVLEAKDSLIGEIVSLSFKARAGANATVDKLRAAVLTWAGTADTVTKDCVSAWNAEGADPTLIANWAYENTPSDLSITETWRTYTINNISLDTSGANNTAVFIWIDNDDGTVGDLVYITDVQLEVGVSAGAYQRRIHSQEEYLCRRFFEIMDKWRYEIRQSGANSTGAKVPAYTYVPKRIVPSHGNNTETTTGISGFTSIEVGASQSAWTFNTTAGDGGAISIRTAVIPIDAEL